MFSVKVGVDPEFLRAHAAVVRAGLPGLAFATIDPEVASAAEFRGQASP